MTESEGKDRTELERESMLDEEGADPSEPAENIEEAEAVEEDLDREGTERPEEDT